jgi:hypothetical protein
MKAHRIRRALLAASAGVLWWLAPVACGQGGGDGSPAPSTGSINERFRFVKGRENITRIDTSSGETWRMPITGDGGWVAFGEARTDDGLPKRIGRYSVTPMSATVGRPKRGAAPQIRLLLVDSDSGRSWLALDTPQAQWALVGEGSAAAESAPRDLARGPSQAPSADEATSAEAPEGAGELSYMGISLEVPKEKVDVSSEQALADVAILVQLLEDESLARANRLWAIGQMGRYPADASVPPLLEALGAKDPVVVIAAVQALSMVGDPSTIPHILKLQSHESPEVRHSVRSTIMEGQ